MNPEFVQLTKSIQLRSDGRSPIAPPEWKGLPVRRNLAWVRAITIVFFVFAVVGSVITIVPSLRPYLPGHMSVPATVTSRQYYFTRGAHCDLKVEFILAGETHTATYDPATACTRLPVPGSAVSVSVDPADPSSVVIVGLDGYRRTLDILFFFLDAAFLAFASWVLWTGLSMYRHFRAVVEKEPWRQLTTTVKQLKLRSRQTTELSLQSLDMKGMLQTFRISYFATGPWKQVPQEGATLSFWILANGNREVLIANQARSAFAPAQISVTRRDRVSTHPFAPS